MTVDPGLAAVRGAVRRHLRRIEPGSVMVACSGGADSLALLAATVHEAEPLGRRVIGAVVDHGLQDGSADVAARVVEQMAALGVDETASARVRVEESGQGPEAAAREARYAVLEEMAARMGALHVLLGHSLDDQAETVLLGLTRGSGGRSIAGMRLGFHLDVAADDQRWEDPAFYARPFFSRPLLDLRRAQTEAACRAEGIAWWDDPHNADPRFLRSRVRRDVLPVLERELGPGVAETLARTATQLQADLEALDSIADTHLGERYDPAAGFDVWDIEVLEPAVRTRMLRRAAIDAGCPPSELFAVHVEALEAQVWNRTHLPKQVQLPGHVTAFREGDRLRFERVVRG